MKIAFILEGFLAKIITGADDTLTHSPIVSSLAKRPVCKIFFFIGMLFSIIFLVIISIFFAGLIKTIPYINIISAILFLFLATLIYLDKFVHTGRKRFERWVKKKDCNRSHMAKFFVIGFLTFFATGVDDVLVYSAILIKDFSSQIVIAAGILIAAILEFVVVFYFSKLLSKLKHVEKFTIFGLVVLAVLVGFGII